MDDPTNDPADGQDRTERHRAFGARPERSLVDQQFASQVTSLVNQEPRTTTEVHQSLGEPQGLTRDQTRYRLDRLSEDGSIQSKKPPGRTSSKIFWGGDTE